MRSLKVLTRSKEAEDPQKEAADPIPRSLRRALIRTHRRDRIFCQHLRGEKPEKGKSPRGKTEEQPRLSKDRGVLWRQEQVSEVETCSPGAAAIYRLEEEELAMLIYLSTKKDASDCLEQLTVNEYTRPGGLKLVWKLLDEGGESMEDDGLEEEDLKEAWAAGWKAKAQQAEKKKFGGWKGDPKGQEDKRKRNSTCSSCGEVGHW